MKLHRTVAEDFPAFEVAPEHTEEHIWYNKYPRLTDAYVGDEIAGRYGDLMQYCENLGWMAWDGKIWEADASLRAGSIAESVAREMLDDANLIENMDESVKAIKMVLPYLNQYRLKAALEAAERKTVVDFDLFDNRPYLLNVENGTIDLATMSFGRHNKNFYITRCAPVKYDADEECPRWDQFLYEVMGGNENLMYFLKKAVGYALTDSTNERVFFILYGSGFNGKTTFLETILSLLGEYEYALATPVETFMMTRASGGIPNDVARLRGARFVYATEGEIGNRLAESRIKRLTGQDTVSARFLYGEWFDFKPTCKLFLGTNHRPRIMGTDAAIWDRIRLIPFTQCFRGKHDPRLGEKLRDELPGILNWALEGCEIWQQEGIGYPDEIKEATGAYRSDMDILGVFIEERCVLEKSLKAQATPLFQAYRKWCEETGERPINRNEFNLSLEERGFWKETETKGAYWYGIGIKGSVN
jgi:putative DNA primase/helicase